jgi:hypothetical protein
MEIVQNAKTTGSEDQAFDSADMGGPQKINGAVEVAVIGLDGVQKVVSSNRTGRTVSTRYLISGL